MEIEYDEGGYTPKEGDWFEDGTGTACFCEIVIDSNSFSGSVLCNENKVAEYPKLSFVQPFKKIKSLSIYPELKYELEEDDYFPEKGDWFEDVNKHVFKFMGTSKEAGKFHGICINGNLDNTHALFLLFPPFKKIKSIKFS